MSAFLILYDTGMKASYPLLAISNLLLMVTTAVVGLMVSGDESLFMRHMLLGVLTAMYTCFVHIVLFMYFVVQEKIVTQSILHHNLDAAYSPRMQSLKSRALKLSGLGIACILTTSGLGAAINIVSGPTAHLVAAFTTICLHGLVFCLQYLLIDECVRLKLAAFGE